METCNLVHVSCGACGSPIAVGGTCGCPDIKHPVGVAAQDRLVAAAEQIKRLQAYPAAVDKIRSYYPIEVFPNNRESLDCRSAKFARSLCDQIHEEAAEAEGGQLEEPDKV